MQALGDKAAIAVTTDVEGAQVKIDGLAYGGTPLLPRPITAGEHEVEVQKANYLPSRVRVNALAGIVTDVRIELAPDPATEAAPVIGKLAPRGTISVLLRGPDGRQDDHAFDGVEVRIDGRPAGEHGPLKGEGDAAPVGRSFPVAPGVRILEIRSPGRDPWRRRVDATAGLAIVTPELVDTAQREARRRTGFVLLGVGVGLAAVGGGTLYAATRGDETSTLLLGASALSFVASAITISLGVVKVHRHRAPDPTAPPPFALAPTEGGVIARTGLAW